MTRPNTTETQPGTREETLATLRNVGGALRTRGLDEETVARFLANDPSLGRAVDDAWIAFLALREEYPDLIAADETEQIRVIQESIVNFYAHDAVNPYVPLAACGPWIVTSKGAVLHDSGGYGMLGLGHTPGPILEAMGKPCVMANVMTPQFSQMRLVNAMKTEIGHRHDGGCPFTGFLFMNSGSESVTVGLRITDINARLETDPEGAHAGMPIRRLALRGSFHGRTDRPAQYSDSARRAYETFLATFRDRSTLLIVEANDVEGLHSAFAEANERGEFIEAVLIEPVMGEGNPGVAVTREFYDAARALTTENGALLLVDSIQAGLRAQGCLSIIDYPGFEDCVPPDMETYSKALNAGQYPLSVLAMTRRMVDLFRTGVYGNTMTACARAMDVGAKVLESITPELRANIRERGAEFMEKLKALAAELDGPITGVQGTGLLASCALDPDRYKAYGTNSTEEYMRHHGIGVIHGGKNALRFTPHFAVTSEELDVIVDAIRDAVSNGPHIG